MAAALEQVLVATLARAQGLGLSVGGETLNVARRKYPGFRRGIDTLPIVHVCCSGDPESSTPWATGTTGNHLVRADYRVWLVLMVAGDGDTVTNDASLVAARGALRKVFETKNTDMPEGVLWVRPESKSPPLDPKGFDKNLDVFALTALVTVIEEAG